jgi:hypothetical protein
MCVQLILAGQHLTSSCTKQSPETFLSNPFCSTSRSGREREREKRHKESKTSGPGGQDLRRRYHSLIGDVRLSLRQADNSTFYVRWAHALIVIWQGPRRELWPGPTLLVSPPRRAIVDLPILFVLDWTT